MTHFPMTERYDLLIASMRAASVTVTYTFIAAVSLLAFRQLVRWLVPATFVPVYFRILLYNATDILLIAAVYVPIILSK